MAYGFLGFCVKFNPYIDLHVQNLSKFFTKPPAFPENGILNPCTYSLLFTIYYQKKTSLHTFFFMHVYMHMSEWPPQTTLSPSVRQNNEHYNIQSGVVYTAHLA